MPPVWKILLIGAGSLLLLVGSCLGYIGYRAHDAEQRIGAFCASVSVGQPSAGLAGRARREGLDVSELPGRAEEGAVSTDVILCSKGVFLAQHVCSVDHSAGIVTRVQKSFDD